MILLVCLGGSLQSGKFSNQAKKSPTKRSRLAEEKDSEKGEESKWLRTYFLVELLDVKSGMCNRVVLIKPLFGLLRRSFKVRLGRWHESNH